MVTSADKRIYREVEATADFHGPATYQELLTFYNDFTMVADSQSGTFVPMTQVKPGRPQDQTLFVIGILPPAVNVTGRLLDRSASLIGLAPDLYTDVPNTEGTAANVSDQPGVTSAEGNDRANLVADKQFWIDYVQMCNRLGVDPFELAKVITHESAWNPNAVAIRGGRPVAKGLTQFLRSIGTKLGGMSNEQWDDMESMPGREQLIYIEPYLKRIGVRGKKAPQIYAKNFGGINLPGFGRGYMSKAKYYSLSAEQQEAVKGACEKIGWKIETMFNAYEQNKWGDTTARYGSYPGFNDGVVGDQDLAVRVSSSSAIFPGVFAAITDAVSVVGDDPGDGPPEIPSDGAASSWQSQGSAEAKDAKKEEEKREGSPMTTSSAGRALLAAQTLQIRAIQLALERMKNTPPLRLLVNPNKFSVKGEKIVQDGSWGRNGPIIEFWGDQQDKISASGKVAGFFAMDVYNAAMPGLTRWARNYSAGYQNLQSMVALYRSNGAMFLPDPTTQYLSPNLAMLGSVYIYYDNILYIGSFDSFSVTENETSPHTVDYSFDFTVRASFMLDRTDDQFTYGAPTLFRVDVPATNLDGQPVSNTAVSNVPQTRNPLTGSETEALGDDAAEIGGGVEDVIAGTNFVENGG